MKNKNIEYINCPFCKFNVEVDVKWAQKNGKVFCNGCCKSIDIRIEDDDEEEVPQLNEFIPDPEDDGYGHL